ncbi:glucan ABC transporter ATP-binding protein/ permease [Orrella daihaiensis]|uniref:Glucan ABC transporter ATP-binding protein/ permease n=1 Tax=Orrella daihaiensis TaxID=2782176 RepID=A0ABY4AKJ9_9BURK|nr:glucan ABC transporter ATP-binding protein/ permease [Orrella daihaiensis]UOD50792.1 glucan ABC transporter ATP-binding protein/ permease [Orrella daihaiensis]
MGLLALYRRVFKLLGHDRVTAYWLMLANVLLIGALLAEPILFGRVIDALTQLSANDGVAYSDMWHVVSPLLLTWVLLGLFAIVCSALIALYADRLAHHRRHVVLRDYFEHVLQLPAHHRHTQHSGRLMKIMLQGTDALWALWLGFFRDYFAAFVAVVVLMPVAFYLNPAMATLLLLLCLIFVLLTRFILRKTDQLQQAVESHYSDMAEHVSDSLGNVALIQSFARVRHEVDRLKHLSHQVVGAQFPALSWWALVNVLTRSATTLTVLAMLVLGLWLFGQQRISIGEIVTFIGFAGLIIGRLEQSVSFANRLSVEAPKLREFFDVLQTAPQVTEAHDAIDPGKVQGAIEFRHVRYAYPQADACAVSDFNLSVKAGQTVALVGPSGAGKSTALALLCRLFDPQAGEILIDGHEIRQWRLEALRRNIGVVFQENLLFNRSVADNLRIGNPEATVDELRRAAADACALEFIEALPQQFATPVGERGRFLSGGQRQRLAIAQVLLKDPAIVVFDEATSALDAQTERLVQQAMQRVREGRTTLIIAHRLSTIRHADQIVYMADGRICEIGTFEELVARQGHFADMVRTQFSEKERQLG